MKQYLDLVSKVLLGGQSRVVKANSTLSLFGERLTFNLQNGFPLVTTRKINFEAVIGELYCFTKGFTDVRDFQKAGVNFWNADCDKPNWNKNLNKDNEFDLGKIYGYQWKQGFGFDQIEKIVRELRESPQSRRHVMITYNPKDLNSMCLPPCYVSHQFYVTNQGTLEMMVHQRSADLMIGVPFDIASFALFQSLIAKEIGVKPGRLIINFGDVHIYKEHVTKAFEQIKRVPGELPLLELKDGIFDFELNTPNLVSYHPQPGMKYDFQVQA